GITSMGDSSNFKRVGIKGISTYLITALLAVIIGLVAGHIFQPGVGLNVNINEFAGSSLPSTEMPTMSVKDFILNLISTNIFKSFADSNLLQVIVFAFFFGVTMNMMGEKSARARVIIYDFSQIIFRM